MSFSVRLFLIRHGQTAWNIGFDQGGGRFRGRADVPLDDVGRAQARATALALQNVPLAAVYASPLSRAMETARFIAQQAGLEVQPLSEIVDVDYGYWQGLTPAEVKAQYPELWHQWLTTPETVQFPGGESLRELRDRALAGVHKIVQQHPNGTVVLVAHQVVNKVLVCELVGSGLARYWRMQQDTCCINEFLYENGDFTTLRLNDTCHLKSDGWQAV